MTQHQEISKTPKIFLKNNTKSHVACYILLDTSLLKEG